MAVILGLATCLAAGSMWAVPLHGFAQDDGLAGRWTGSLTIMGTELGFSVEFSRESGALSAVMDIPTQASGLPLINVSENEATVHFELQAGPGLAAWEGDRIGDAIEVVVQATRIDQRAGIALQRVAHFRANLDVGAGQRMQVVREVVDEHQQVAIDGTGERRAEVMPFQLAPHALELGDASSSRMRTAIVHDVA